MLSDATITMTVRSEIASSASFGLEDGAAALPSASTAAGSGSLGGDGGAGGSSISSISSSWLREALLLTMAPPPTAEPVSIALGAFTSLAAAAGTPGEGKKLLWQLWGRRLIAEATEVDSVAAEATEVGRVAAEATEVDSVAAEVEAGDSSPMAKAVPAGYAVTATPTRARAATPTAVPAGYAVTEEGRLALYLWEAQRIGAQERASYPAAANAQAAATVAAAATPTTAAAAAPTTVAAAPTVPMPAMSLTTALVVALGTARMAAYETAVMAATPLGRRLSELADFNPRPPPPTPLQPPPSCLLYTSDAADE